MKKRAKGAALGPSQENADEPGQNPAAIAFFISVKTRISSREVDGKMLELVALSFWADMDLVVTILLFFMIYWILTQGLIDNSLAALVVAAVIVWLVVIPYGWFRYLLFIVLFLGKAFGEIKFKDW